MKKRILALAMTLVMVFSSMAVLSTASFAADDHEDCLHFDESWPTVPAYLATVNVDGRAQSDEPYIMVQEYLPHVRYGVAWDYENLYFAFYNYGVATDIAYQTIDITVGGSDYKVDVANATIEGPGADKAKVANTSNVYIEISIPLSALDLHFTPDTVYAPMELKVVSSKGTDEAKANIELTGRSIYKKTASWDNYDNAKLSTYYNWNGSVVSVETEKTTRVNASGMKAAADAGDSYVYYDYTNKDSDLLEFVDKGAANLRLTSNFGSLAGFVDHRLGGSYCTDFDLKVGDIPVVDADFATVPKLGGVATAGISFTSCMADNDEAPNMQKGLGYCAILYNHSVEGLSIAVGRGANRDNADIVRLDDYVGNGKDYFTISFTTKANGSVEVRVNDKLVTTTDNALASTDNPGASSTPVVSVSYERKVALAAANTVLTMRNIVFSQVVDVDFARLKAVVNGEALNATVSVAPLYDYQYGSFDSVMAFKDYVSNSVTVGGLTKAAYYWSLEDEAIYIAYDISGVHKIVTSFGEKELTLKVTQETKPLAMQWYGDKREGSFILNKAEVSGIDGATVELFATTTVAMVKIPMHEIDTARGDLGKVIVDVTITAIKETQRKDGNPVSRTAISEDVSLVIGYRDLNGQTGAQYTWTKETGIDEQISMILYQAAIYDSWAIEQAEAMAYGKYDITFKNDYQVDVLEPIALEAAGKHIIAGGNYNTVNTNPGAAGHRDLPSRLFNTIMVPTNSPENVGKISSGVWAGGSTMDMHIIAYNIYNVSPVGQDESITASTDDDTLYLVVGSKSADMTEVDKIDLGVKLGERFTLEYEIGYADNAADAVLSVYVNGNLVGTSNYAYFVTNARENKATDGVSDFPTWTGNYKWFPIYADVSNTTNIDYTIFNFGISLKDVCMDAAELLALFGNTQYDQPEIDTEEEMIDMAYVLVKGDSNDSTSDYTQRLVAQIDNLDYKYAGFQYATANGGVTTKRVYNGYDSIIVNGEETKPEDGKYWVVLDVAGGVKVDEVFFVRPFAVDADRNYVYGDTYKIFVDADGAVTKAELVASPTVFG